MALQRAIKVAQKHATYMVAEKCSFNISPRTYWLSALYEQFKEQASKFLTQVKEFVTTHPFVVISGILVFLTQVLGAMGVWNKIFNIKKVPHLVSGKIVIEKYVNQHFDIDLTNKTVKEIIIKLSDNDAKSVLVTNVNTQLLEVFESKNVELVYVIFGGVKHHAKDYVVEAKPSNDSITPNVRKVKIVEARTSGDNITVQRQKQKLIEAKPSNDAITTRISKPKMIEASASGDNITMKVQKTKFIESEDFIPAEMQMWKDQTAQNLISARIFSNLYKIAVIRKGEHIPLLNGLFVRGNVM